MSADYPNSYPDPPRRLERSRSDRFLGGVCGGVARYLNMDPTLVRVLWAVLTLVLSGAPLIVYLVMLFVVPEEGRRPPGQVGGPGAGWQASGRFDRSHFPADQPGDRYPGGWQPQGGPGYGPPPAEPQAAPTPPPSGRSDEGDVWGPDGAPWEQSRDRPNRQDSAAGDVERSDDSARPNLTDRNEPSRGDQPLS